MNFIICLVVKLRNQAYVDGKDYDNNNPFKFSSISFDSNFVFIDDLLRNFNVELLFSKITEGYSFSQKFVDVMKFNKIDNPKTITTSNFSILRIDESTKRRNYEMEIYRKYNSSYTPADDFGMLFYDWDNKEWNKFYNFMINCVVQYHKNNNKLYYYDIQEYYSASHVGYIYQATNWIYIGIGSNERKIFIDGIRQHRRNLFDVYGTSSLKKLKELLGYRFTYSNEKFGKHKYVYVLGKSKKDKKRIMNSLIVTSLPYPKGNISFYNDKSNIFINHWNN